MRWRGQADSLSETTKLFLMLGVYINNNFGPRYYGKAVNISRRVTAAYDKVLAYGLAKTFYVVVVDKHGKILSDSRAHPSGSKPSTIEGLTLDEMRNQLGGSLAEGTGRIVTNGTQSNMSYQTVGDWTVVAVESLPAPQECLRTGDDKCR